jgi:hypothetical protein
MFKLLVDGINGIRRVNGLMKSGVISINNGQKVAT